MKTRVSPTLIVSLALTMACLPASFARGEPIPSPATAPDGVPTATQNPAISNPAPASVTAPTLAPSQAATVRPETPLRLEKLLPPKVRLSPWTTEIVKLAQSGIEDAVMLTFIDNSGTFNLGADQIVHLRDLGISNEVISAMLLHDKELVSGIRSLTISSEPEWEPILPKTAAGGSVASSKATTPPAIPASPSTEMRSEAARLTGGEPPPEVSLDLVKAEPLNLESTVTDHFISAGPAVPGTFGRAPETTAAVYRVREPNPVPLTIPILYVQAAERTPNTFIIELFPRTER